MSLRSWLVLTIAVSLTACPMGSTPGDDGGTGGGAGGGSTSNQVPTISPIAAVSVTEGETKTVAITAADADGDTVTLALLSPPPFASVNGSTLTLAPGLSDSGEYTLTVTASDGRGGSATATVTVTVLNSGRPPMWTSITPVMMAENSMRTLTLMATDPDGAQVTYALVMSPPSWASLASDQLTLAPGFDAAGTANIFVKATSANGGEALTSVTVIVTNVNRSPVFTVAAVTVSEGQTATSTFAAMDPDGDALTYTLGMPAPSWASLTGATASFAPDFFVVQGMASTMVQLTATATDAQGAATNATFSVTVTDVNGPPTFTMLAPIALDEGDTPIVPLVATDPDGDTITFATQGTFPTWATVANGPGRLLLSPDQTVATAAMPFVQTLAITASDGQAGHTPVTQMVQVTVTNVNRPPTLASLPDQTLSEGAALGLQVGPPISNDPDGEPLSFTVTGLTQGGVTIGTFDAMNSVINFGPQCPASTQSPFTVTVTVRDPSGATATRTFSVTVLSSNSPPTVTGLEQVNSLNAAPIPVGSDAGTSPVVLRAQALDCQNDAVRLEAEVRPFAIEFDGGTTHSGALAAIDAGVPTVLLTGLTAGSYKWRIRGVDQQAGVGNWVTFNGGQIAFTVPVQDVSGVVCIGTCASSPTTTNSATVSIDLSQVVAGAGRTLASMQFSNDNLTFSPIETFAVTKAGWSLAPSVGSKTVFVRVLDNMGSSGLFTDTITLDNSPPNITTFVINGGAAATNSTTASLTFSTSDLGTGIVSVSASNDGVTFMPISLTAPATWMLTAGNATKTVHLRVTDGAGNQTTLTDTIIFDNAPPTLSGVSVAGGATFTSTTAVTVTYTANDTGGSNLSEVCWGLTNTPSNCQAYSASVMATLAAQDGSQTLSVLVRDAAGNSSMVVSDSIVLDTTPPQVGAISLAGGAAFTRLLSVPISVPANDTSTGFGGALEVAFAINGGAFGGYVALPTMPTLPSVVLPVGDGLKTVQARVRDAAGNVSAMPFPSDGITLDQTPPSVTSFTINNGAVAATSSTVNLFFTATDATSMLGASSFEASNDASTFSPISSTTGAPWNLTGGNGVRTVTLRVTDLAGNSTTIADSITVDTVPPTLSSFALQGGAAFVNSLTMTANSTSPDADLESICLTNMGGSEQCLPYAPSVMWTVPSGEGMKTVSARLRDLAGNYSSATFDSITVDLTPPVFTALTLSSGFTNQLGITATGNATDSNGVADIAFSFDGSTFAAPVPWVPAGTSVTLPAGDGVKTVTARVRDTAGNTSAMPFPSRSITLDTAAPTGTVTLAGGAAGVATGNTTYVVTASDVTSAVTHMCVRESPSTQPGVGDGCWVAFSATAQNITLSTGDGNKTVYAWFRDSANNISAAGVNDAVFVDSVNPTLTSVVINSGISWTRLVDVQVTLTGANDVGVGLAQVCIGSTTPVPDTACVPFANPASFTLPAGDANKTLYVRVRDGAGRTSPEQNDSIILDTVSPGSTSVSINAGAAYTTSQMATLTLSATDSSSGMNDMCLKLVNTPPANAADGCWEGYATTRSFDLGSGNGSKTVYAWFLDNADNFSTTPATDSIIFDNTAPNTPAAPTLTPGHRQLTVTWPAVADVGGSGIQGYEVGWSVSSGSGYAYTSLNPGTSVTLSNLSNNATYFVVVRVTDNAGNRVQGPEASAAPRFAFPNLGQRLPTGEVLRAVYQRNANEEFAVGGAGIALFGNSAGISADLEWASVNRVDPQCDATLNAIAKDIDREYYHVVGASGCMSVSSDLLHWTKTNLLTTADSWNGIVNHTASCSIGCVRSYVMVGANGANGFIYSRVENTLFTDTFTLEVNATGKPMRAVASNGTYILAVGDNGAMYRATSATGSYTQLTLPANYTTADFKSVTAVPGGNDFYVGSVRVSAAFPITLFRVAAATGTVTALTGLEGIHTYALSAPSSTSIFFGGYDVTTGAGRVARYSGSGSTFTSIGLPGGPVEYPAIWSIDARTSSDVTAVGNLGQVLTTLTATTNWANRTTGTFVTMNDFTISPGAMTFGVTNYLTNWGSSGVVTQGLNGGPGGYCTTNVGSALSWSSVAFQNTGSAPYYHPAIIVGTGGNIRQSIGTTCGGISYGVVSSPTTNDLLAVECASGVSNPCVAVGADRTILRGSSTSFAGVASGPVGVNYTGVAMSVNGSSQRVATIIGNNGAVRTYNFSAGLGSETILPGAPALRSIATNADGSRMIALAPNSSNQIFLFNGSSWVPTVVPAFNGEFLYTVAYGGGVTWYIGGSGIIFKSTNNGTNWFPLEPNSSALWYSIRITGVNTVCAAGSSGILVCSDTGGQ